MSFHEKRKAIREKLDEAASIATTLTPQECDDPVALLQDELNAAIEQAEVRQEGDFEEGGES